MSHLTNDKVKAILIPADSTLQRPLCELITSILLVLLIQSIERHIGFKVLRVSITCLHYTQILVNMSERLYVDIPQSLERLNGH